MKTSEVAARWTMLVHVTEQCRDDCARRLASVLARQQEAAVQMQTLADYRQSYQEQRQGAERNGIPADELRNYQSFVTTLEFAGDQQSVRLAAISQQVEQIRSELREQQRKLHSYRVMQDRQAAQERVRDARRAQTLEDEMASRMRLAM